jgi:hypothetical protein
MNNRCKQYVPNEKQETKISQALRDLLEGSKYRMMVRKLHGNMFQAGMPDLLMLRTDGITLYVEMKYTEHRKLTCLDVVGMLETSQQGFFYKAAKTSGKHKLFICVGSPHGYCLVNYPPKNMNAEVEWLSVEAMAALLAVV